MKFLWAPLVDALDVPVLSKRLGRRRGWLLFSQASADGGDRVPRLLRSGGLAADRRDRRAARRHGVGDPGHRGRCLPRGKPDENEQAAGMASYVAAYRIGTLVSGAGALFLVSGFQAVGRADGAWTACYVVMAVLILIGIATTCCDRAGKVRGRQTPRMRETIRSSASSTRRSARFAIFCRATWRSSCWPSWSCSSSPTRCLRADGAVRHRPRLFAHEYAAILNGVGLAATLLGGFAGGFVARACRCRPACGSAASCRRSQISRFPGRRSSATTWRG